MLNRKYLLSVEGNDVASNLKWMLASNSVVLMQPPVMETWAMEGMLLPYIHYVPLSEDFEDLKSKVLWCNLNSKVCELISKNATEFMRQFNNKSTENLITCSVVNSFLQS